MEIYLIRHTTPDVVAGTCYGQTDLNVVHSFAQEAAAIKPHLPPAFSAVYSSPLQRCYRLARQLFPRYGIRVDNRLKEIHCGEWEMQLWDDIEPTVLQPWMEDFVNNAFPGGESYVQLYQRTQNFFNEAAQKPGSPLAIVSHGGVLRSILCYLEGTPLHESFSKYGLRYGCVIKLQKNDGVWTHTVLHNPDAPKEQHKPKALQR